MDASEAQKRAAAEAGAERVRSGMIVGLGTGSTARFLVERIGAKVRAGQLRDLVCIATSEDTSRRARAEGLVLSDLVAHPKPDIALDGADEVTPELDLIKGLGGAMLREKRVALAAKRFVVLVDAQKRVPRLGVRAPVPVEVAPETLDEMTAVLAAHGCRPVPRGGGDYRTDNANAVVDCHFEGGIPDPRALATALDRDPRVAAHGLFLGVTHEVLVGTDRGVEVMRADSPGA